MILQALYQYSESLRRYQAEYPETVNDTGGAMPAPGMEWKSIPYRIILRPDGSFVDMRRADDRPQEVAKDNARTSSVSAQLLWDHLGYVLGIPRSREPKDVKRAPEQFKAFVDAIEALPDEIEEFRPIKLFYKKEEYEHVRRHELIAEMQDKKDKAWISFELEGSDGRLITSHTNIKAYLDPDKRFSSDSSERGVCLVTGRSEQTIALTHEKVAVGRENSPLISFQKGSGLDSYFKEQGLNAPISVQAADAIGSALKHLLQKDQPTNYTLAGTTYIFWTNLFDNTLLRHYAQATFEGLKSNKAEDEDPDAKPKTKGAKKKKGADASDVNPREEVEQVLNALRATYGSKDKIIDSKERFYILGLMGQKGRHAVKLFVEGSVREIVGNTLQHIQDMNIVASDGSLEEEYPRPRSLFVLVSQLKPKGKKLDKFSENLIQDLVHSIVSNTPYPASVQKLCLDRIHHERSVGEWKAAILKGYLNRKYRQLNKTEIVTMALDKTQTNRAYLAGRLFAVLEKIQHDASGGVNASIRDRYYGAASTNPSNVFGRLIELSHHHMSKLRRRNAGYAHNLERELRDIFVHIPGDSPQFPIHFNPDEQSLFAIGYYHQRTDLWAKKEDKVQ